MAALDQSVEDSIALQDAVETQDYPTIPPLDIRNPVNARSIISLQALTRSGNLALE